MPSPASRPGLVASVLLAALALSACITASARLRAGPTVDMGGEVGYEIGVSAGLGISVSDKSGVRSMPGFSTSDRAGAAFTETAEYGAMDDEFVWAAGLAGELATSSDEQALWLFGAGLVPLIGDADRDPGHEKIGFASTSRWALSAGLEGRAGIATITTTTTTDRDSDSRGIFAILPALDFTFVGTLDP